MDRLDTPPKRVTSLTWGPPPPYKQALNKSSSQVKELKNTSAGFAIAIKEISRATATYVGAFGVATHVITSMSACTTFVNIYKTPKFFLTQLNLDLIKTCSVWP